MNILKSFISNYFIAFCGLGLLLFTEKIIGSDINPFLIILMVLGIGIMYNLDPYINSIKNLLSKNSNLNLNQFSFASILFVLLLGLFLFFGLIKIMTVLSLFIFLFATTIGILYLLPIVKISENHFSLKNIPYLKVPLIALVWTIITLIIPLIEANKMNGENYLFITERFLFIFAVAIPFDIRDYEKDKKKGIYTYPVIWNNEVSKLISIVSIFGFLFCVYLNKKAIMPISLSLYFTGLYAIIFILRSSTKRNKTFFTFGVDGVLLAPIAFYWIILFMLSLQ